MISLMVVLCVVALVVWLWFGWISLIWDIAGLFSRRRDLRPSDLRGDGAAPFWGSPGSVFPPVGADYRDDPLDAPAPIVVSPADFSAYLKATQGVENPCGGQAGAEWAKSAKIADWKQASTEAQNVPDPACERVASPTPAEVADLRSITADAPVAAAGAAMAHDDRLPNWVGLFKEGSIAKAARSDRETVIEASWDGKRFTKGTI